MSLREAEWRVLDHESIVQLDEHLWTVQGVVPKTPLGRRMTIARKENGGLVLHSPIALDLGAMAQLDELGPVEEILIPSAVHRMDAARFAARYPGARVLCPEGATKKVEEACRVDGTFLDLTEDTRLSLRPLEGTKRREGVLTVRGPKGTCLVFCDAVFNLPHSSGLGGLLIRCVGSSGGPRVTPMARLLLVDDKAAFRSDLLKLSESEGLYCILVAHRVAITENPGSVLRGVAEAL